MATKVNGLIQKVNPGNNTEYSIASTAYGYCETAAATAAKVVDMTGFTLLEGTTIHVKFKNNNTAASPTLNVNGTGAKPIVQYGTTAASTGDATTGWYAGAVVSFTYDGTSWVRDQGFNTNTTYPNAIQVYNRTSIGTSPNFDNPGVNGLFEIRDSTETTGESGAKPFNGYGAFFSAKTPDNIAMLQLAGNSSNGWYIRGKQSANVTLSGVTWDRLVTNSGTWPISITGNAATATTASSANKLGSADVGNKELPIYLNKGTATQADGFNVGGNLLPREYLSASNCTLNSYDGLSRTFTLTAPSSTSGRCGLAISSNKVYIPWGEYIIVSCEIWSPVAAVWDYDENTSLENNTTNIGGNDFWTNHSASATTIPANEWTKVWFRHGNTRIPDTSGNSNTLPDKRGIFEYSIFGIKLDSNTSGKQFKIRNVMAYYGSDTGAKFNYSPSAAISNITRSGTTFTATRVDGSTFTFTQQDNNSVTGVKGNAESSYRTGNVNLTPANIGAVNKAGDTMTGTLSLKPASGEGGELHLCASTENTNQAGIILDQLNSTFRIFGIPSADGTTKTGTGTPLVIDPYAKTITGGYTLTGSLSGNATSAGKWATARTLTIGNKGQSVDGSQDVSWTLHDILNGSQIGTSTTWQQYNPGVYYVASNAAFTGEGNPEDANGGLTPYRYGQLIVSRAGNGGVAQFYISHQDSGNSGRGIKYRSGWNSTYNASWDTLLDSTNYTNYTVTKTGTGASGTWGISITGNAATATKFASNQSVALTGDVTGSASSQAGWSIATTLANSGVTANTYGNTSQQTPSHGETFNIPYFKVDAKGRVTQAGTTTVKLPADSNTDTKVTQNNTTATNDYRVLLSASANDTAETNTVNKSTNLRYNPSTNTLSTGNISGSGNLTITGNTNLNGETYAESITAGSLLVNGNANFVQSPTAPTPVATSNDTTIATTAFVMNAFTANDAMVFKGVVNANGDLPATHKQGWTYRVATAGTYAGKVCEIGDIIICVTDGTAANNDHWAVIQNNVDGAVYRGTNAFTDANVIVADSTNGKVKSSGKTITATAPSSSAGDTTIPTSKAVWSAISGASGYGKTGTVTSVRVQATAPIVSSSNGTATTSLNTTISLAATSANYVIAGPSSGTTTAVPTYRKLVAADIPSLTKSKISDFPTNISAFTNDSGYVKSSGVTSITLKAGTGISLDTDNTAITTSGTRTITNAGVRATTINGNYLRVNTNGTNADLTIPYATKAEQDADGFVIPSTYVKLVAGTSIPATSATHADLNALDWQKTGSYCVSYNGNIPYVDNLPSDYSTTLGGDQAFMMNVYSPLSSDGTTTSGNWIYRTQEIIPFNNHIYRWRRLNYTNGSGTWIFGNWTRQVLSDNNTITTVTTSGSGNAITAISASNGAITATKGSTFLTSHQDISGKADKSATVSTLAWDSTNKKITKTINGTTTDVVQFAAGSNVTLTGASGKLTIATTDTDTKNTAGSTDTTSKIFLIGATSQADNPQTYSDSEVYVQNGTLYAVKAQDLSGTANNKPALIVGGADTSTHMEIDANEIQAKTNGTSVAQLYINNDGGLVTVGSGGLAITSLTASQAVSTDANKKLVSTNLTVSDPTASGTGITYIATISQGATGKITATKSTVRSASTSQTGVTQYTADNLNTWINQLGTGSSTPTDADYYISQYVGGGTTTTTYHRRPMSALWEYIKGKITAGTYWANIKISDAAKYNAAPEMATLKLNGNTSATAASTSNVTLVYDTTSQALNFVFA